MKSPKMILFDYGQTLADERPFDGVAGTRAVLAHATANRYGRTAEEIQAEANAINHQIGRFDPERKHLFQLEVPNHMFTAYLYESMGVTLPLSAADIDRIFWYAASPARPTDGFPELLERLHRCGIRTGVISNITYCSEVVRERINTLLPHHHFEFIIATSEYMFRKPHPRIFRLALEKAGLLPEDVWYCGDNYRCDVLGAQEAGLTAIHYLGATDHPQPVDGVTTIRHWQELDVLLG